ncbi:hypothetical protein [Streptomyces sp. NPDC001135]
MEIAGRRLPGGSWWGCEVPGRDAARLRPATGCGLTDPHGPEADSAAPARLSRRLAVREPVLRASTAGETACPGRTPGGASRLVVVFGTDAGGPEPVSCPVAAEWLGVRQGLVRRPPRARAKASPGLRDWPGPPLPTD